MVPIRRRKRRTPPSRPIRGQTDHRATQNGPGEDESTLMGMLERLVMRQLAEIRDQFSRCDTELKMAQAEAVAGPQQQLLQPPHAP